MDSDANTARCHWKVKQFLEKLGRQPSKKVLDLNNCALSSRDVAELASMIHLLPELEEIDLSWNDFIGGALEPLPLQFKHLQELKVLQLSNCRLTAKDLAFLGDALETISHLEILDLSWNTGLGGSLSLLTAKIPKGSKLKTLKLTDCNLTSEDGESLAQVVNRVHNLEILDLSINKKIGCSLKNIAQELKYVSGLKVLNLSMCGLKQDGLQWLDNALQHLLELRKLDVSCNKGIGGGFQNVEAHLASLSNLEVLDLHQCSITEEDMAVLSQIIPLLSRLQELDLSSNKNVGVSSDQLLSRLRFLPNLKSVLLSNCSLQHDSFASFAVGIQTGHLALLQTLDLSYNHDLSDRGWTKLCQVLAALEQLSELDVSLRPSSSCHCGDWLSQLLATLPKLPVFTELGLQGWVLSEVQQKELEHCHQDNECNILFDI
nr:leucine-rich repeat-containing protein 31 isoform X2 [Pogona vitticeps]